MLNQVRALLKQQPISVFGERRGEYRYSFPRLLLVTPVAEDGETALARPLCAVGKHLSEHGVGFFHPDPLPYRLVVVSAEAEPEKWLSFLVDVRHCRFTTYGWYESGGRLLRAVRPISPGARRAKGGAADDMLNQQPNFPAGAYSERLAPARQATGQA